MELYRNYSNA